MLCNIESNRLARLSYVLASQPNIEDTMDVDSLNVSPEDRALIHQLLQCGISVKKLVSQVTILGGNYNWFV